jgi:quinolinate synthase
MGIVAHYYMDVKLQGVLQALQDSFPDLAHCIGIAANSLKMGDLAMGMCANHGVTSVVCLGVDFMAKSGQEWTRTHSRLSRHGQGNWMFTSRIGRRQYVSRLVASSQNTDPALHVIHINTSLETKAISSSRR